MTKTFKLVESCSPENNPTILSFFYDNYYKKINIKSPSMDGSCTLTKSQCKRLGEWLIKMSEEKNGRKQ